MALVPYTKLIWQSIWCINQTYQHDLRYLWLFNGSSQLYNRKEKCSCSCSLFMFILCHTSQEEFALSANWFDKLQLIYLCKMKTVWYRKYSQNSQYDISHKKNMQECISQGLAGTANWFDKAIYLSKIKICCSEHWVFVSSSWENKLIMISDYVGVRYRCSTLSRFPVFPGNLLTLRMHFFIAPHIAQVTLTVLWNGSGNLCSLDSSKQIQPYFS